MHDHAAFLRAVNLGGRRRATGADLRATFAGLGFDPVDSFRASGNVVFGAGDAARAELAARIEQALARSLGFDVTVFLRTADEVRAISAHAPFGPAEVERSAGKLQVVVLGDEPAPAARADVAAMATADDRLAFRARELYWLPRAGMSESALDVAAVERLLGPATIRTKGTIDLLASKYFGA